MNSSSLFTLGDETEDLSDEDAIPMPNSKLEADFSKPGFGAGGLSPALFSHIMYNWGTLTLFNPTERSSANYQHEMTYKDVPAVVMPSDSLEDGKQKQVAANVGRMKRRLVGTDGESVIVSAAKRVKKAVSQAVQRNKLKGYKQIAYTHNAHTTHTRTCTHTHMQTHKTKPFGCR